jgi:hypothetical protein
MRKRRDLLAPVLLGLLLGVPLWVTSAALASTPYDGLWSVAIITDSGNCDRGYRYALRITNGRVTYDDPSFNVSGQVNAGGQVRVVVRYGDDVATGTGRLSRDYGQGTWSGHSSTSQCSGHWEADRRG